MDKPVMSTCVNTAHYKDELIKWQEGRIEELELALKDAKIFSELVEIWGRTDCEIYKHELKSSADLSLDRINRALSRER